MRLTIALDWLFTLLIAGGWLAATLVSILG
jgi:hypothetical protein